MRLQVRAAERLLDLVASGKFSLSEAKRNFLQVLEAVAQHQCAKVLLDGRDLVGNPKTMERFFYGEFAAVSVLEFGQRGVSPATQYVLKEPVLDPGKFGETVAVNRGMNVRVFGTIGMASAERP